MEFRFRFGRYGIDVPVVKPYSRSHDQLAPRPLRADARRNRERVLAAAARGLRRARPRGADGRRRAPRRRRRRHRLPPLPHQGGADRGARGRPLRAGRCRRPGGARARRPVGGVTSTRCGRARRCSPPTARSPRSSASSRARCRSAPSSSSEHERDVRRAAAARAGGGRRCAPDLVLDDIPMFMCGIGFGDPQAAPLPGRLAAPRGDRDRRPARQRPPRGRCPPSLWGYDRPGNRHRSRLQEVAWDLSHLLDGAGDDPQAAVDALLADAQARADAFAARYAGKRRLARRRRASSRR